jgi:hypothetical protein
MARVRICLLAALTATLAFAAPQLVRAGGGQSDLGMDTENGPAFFGFVRGDDGLGVAGANVIARLKTGDAVVTRTDLLGLYKIPGVGKSVDADDVTISCAKDGYKQANVVPRPRADADSKDPIEVDCNLQKQ